MLMWFRASRSRKSGNPRFTLGGASEASNLGSMDPPLRYNELIDWSVRVSVGTEEHQKLKKQKPWKPETTQRPFNVSTTWTQGPCSYLETSKRSFGWANPVSNQAHCLLRLKLLTITFPDLKDCPIFLGHSSGAHKNTNAEAVFTGSLVGYLESMTDPSYKGQIPVWTRLF